MNNCPTPIKVIKFVVVMPKILSRVIIMSKKINFVIVMPMIFNFAVVMSKLSNCDKFCQSYILKLWNFVRVIFEI
jgi:hypothetical protein